MEGAGWLRDKKIDTVIISKLCLQIFDLQVTLGAYFPLLHSTPRANLLNKKNDDNSLQFAKCSIIYHCSGLPKKSHEMVIIATFILQIMTLRLEVAQ